MRSKLPGSIHGCGPHPQHSLTPEVGVKVSNPYSVLSSDVDSLDRTACLSAETSTCHNIPSEHVTHPTQEDDVTLSVALASSSHADMLTKSVAQGAGQQSICNVKPAFALSSTKAVAQGAGPSVDALCHTTPKSAAHGADLDRKLAVVSGKLQSAAQGAGLMTQPMYSTTLSSIAEVAREYDSDTCLWRC